MKQLILSKLLAPLLYLSLVQVVFGDLTVDVTKSQVLYGLVNPRTVQTFILFDQEGSEPEFAPAAIIQVKTNSKFVRVKARKNLFEGVNVTKLNDTDYLLLGEGKYAVEVTTFDPELGIDERILTVELGPSEPKPTPGPSPSPIPDDEFNNLGKRVFDWSKDLPKRKELASIYRNVAKALTENPVITINDATTILSNDRSKLLGSELTKYSNFIENTNADLRSRWPLSKGEFAKYLITIAVGLEG